MASRAASRIRPGIRALEGYTPGEQPQESGLIKLNTNENPYPPSPRVLKATRAAVDGRLRLYPNPGADALRARLARLHGCTADHLIVGNGSDELLALATRAFVEPADSAAAAVHPALATIQYFHPSYSLYPVLAGIHGARTLAQPLAQDFALPRLRDLRRSSTWEANAALTLVTTPNAPSGRGYATGELDALCRSLRGVVILDEAYVDFARENALELALKHPHVIVSRTFSKAYSLCFQRVGYFVGPPELIRALHTIRDSYNVNGLGQVAALATLTDLPYYRRNFRRLIATREQLRRELTGLGWSVLPSATNFLLARPAGPPAEEWLQRLRDRKILVRWFRSPEVNAYLRITVGTEAEVATLLKVVRQIQAGERTASR